MPLTEYTTMPVDQQLGLIAADCNASTLAAKAAMWETVGKDLGVTANDFAAATNRAEAAYGGPDGDAFVSRSRESHKTLVKWHDAITSSGAPAAIQAVADQIQPTFQHVQQARDLKNQAIKELRRLQKESTMAGLAGPVAPPFVILQAVNPTVGTVKATTPEQIEQFYAKEAGAWMNNLGDLYLAAGAAVEKADAKVPWRGLNGGAPTGSPGGPSATPGGGPAGEQPGGGPAGGDQAQQEAGGEQAPGGGAAGGEQPGGEEVPPTGMPTMPELSGSPVPPTLPPPTTMPPLNVPPVGGGPGSVTMPPIGGFGGLGGGFGGGGFGGGGGGGGTASRGVPVAGAPVAGPNNLAPARLAPGLPPLSTAGGTAGSAGGGMPPMMPPMGGHGAGMGGGEGGGQPGSGAAKRPTTKGKRRDDSTPGLPSMLAGRSESTYTPAYPTVSIPVTESEVPSTLDIVDEDLWQLSDGSAAPADQPPVRRLRR